MTKETNEQAAMAAYDADWKQRLEAAREHDRRAAAYPALVEALRLLVGADNGNYERDTMRYEGYFDKARAALKAAGEK